MFLTTLHVCFVSRNRERHWITQLRSLQSIRVASILQVPGLDVGNVLELVDYHGNKNVWSNFSAPTFQVQETIADQFAKLGLTNVPHSESTKTLADVELKQGVVAPLDSTSAVILPMSIVVSNPEATGPSILPRRLTPNALVHVSYLITTPSMGKHVARPVRRRWSDFVELWDTLRHHEERVPDLPADLVRASRREKLDEEFVEARRQAAEDWLNLLCTTNVSSNPRFRGFVGWPE